MALETRRVERELGALYPKGRSRIALTGASGYIGHNLLHRLTEHADVIALSQGRAAGLSSCKFPVQIFAS
ncbi:hypothetical protein [Paenibacillus polymyxa]|uniref:hypothetical protein n=1 Tax=Paenibacillus polymyxa TaxID=1406 RepID=UPI00234904BF|nr:hypothetical protein [Paenibacillus polymyxa]WCM63093.1 hypothetical protein OYT09_09240 [Paenibacillus polymyxa]